MKKLIALVLVTIMTLSLTACGGARATVEIDNTKTILTVANWNGGVGTEWLNKAIEKFEEQYKDYSFEEGKKGVQVIIGSNNKTTMEGETLKDIILSDDNHDDIFFTEGVFYYWWAQNGKMLDITEYVEQPLTEFGESESIADKMETDLVEAMKVDGKIYALPFWQGCYGMVYNATLFDENEWYFAADGSFTDAKGNLGAGPDGEVGTYDDGMPATYDDFFKLLDEINDDNCTPIQFPGASQEYLSWVLAELAADNMGYDQFMLNFSFDGTAELVKTDSANYETMTFDTESVQITKENAYELSRQPGIAYAVNFAERLLQNSDYYVVNNCLSGSFKITQSQLEFVRNTSVSSKKNVAIMIDGNWWENEATASFQETYGTKATKHDAEVEYKWMPFPKATAEDVGSENLMVSAMDSYCFIKSNVAENKKEAAVKFLQFIHTDAQMTEFTETTGIRKPMDYQINTDNMTSFEKSISEAMDASRTVYPMANNELYCYASSDFRFVQWMRSRYDAGADATPVVTIALTQLAGGEYKYDTKDYVDGIYNYRKNEQWSKYSPVLE